MQSESLLTGNETHILPTAESQKGAKSDGPPDVPDYHRGAAEADFFAGGGFFGASSGAITGLGSDDDSDGLFEGEDGLEEIVEDTYE